MSIKTQEIRPDVLSGGNSAASVPSEEKKFFGTLPWSERDAFVRAVLAMEPGDTLQGVLGQVDATAATERAAHLAHNAETAAKAAASLYVANLATGHLVTLMSS